MNRPEVIISKAADKFDANGTLTEEPTRKFLATFMKAFGEWTERINRR